MSYNKPLKLPRPRAIIPQYGPHARIVGTKFWLLNGTQIILRVYSHQQECRNREMIERKEWARKETIRKFMSLKSVRTF